MTEEKGTQRLAFIDIAKAFGIILVVLGHTVGAGEIHDYIYSFHMPLFFIIYGFTTKWKPLGIKDLGREMYKYIERYAVPYFILMLIAGELSLHNIVNYILVNRNVTYMYPLLAKWFLPCFFVSVCYSKLFYQLVGRARSGIAGILGAAVFFILGLYFNGARCGDGVLWLANVALMGSAFIYIGCLLRLLYNKYWAFCKKYYGAILTVIMIVLSVVSYSQNFAEGGCMTMVAGIYGTWYWFVLSAVSGSVSVMLIAACVSGWGKPLKCLRYLGQNSIVIMMFHSLFIHISARIFTGGGLASLARTVFCIVLCVPCIELVNRYVPSLAGRPQGNPKWFFIKE